MTKINRRTALALAGAAVASPAIGRADTALPDKTLKVLVGFPAGGGTDVMARVIAEALKQRTGRNVIIDNKGGASGTLAGAELKNGAQDGTTICYMPSATVVQKLTMPQMPFDPLTDGLKKFQDSNYQAALPLFSTPSLAKTSLADYAAYYKGLAQLRLGQVADARRTFDAVIDRKVPGYVSVAAGLASGEAAELSGDYAGAVAVYERVADQKAAITEELLSRLGRAALAAGDRAKAAQAFLRDVAGDAIGGLHRDPTGLDLFLAEAADRGQEQLGDALCGFDMLFRRAEPDGGFDFVEN